MYVSPKQNDLNPAYCRSDLHRGTHQHTDSRKKPFVLVYLVKVRCYVLSHLWRGIVSPLSPSLSLFLPLTELWRLTPACIRMYVCMLVVLNGGERESQVTPPRDNLRFLSCTNSCVTLVLLEQRVVGALIFISTSAIRAVICLQC